MDSILNSLSKSYLAFLSHYRMTKPVANYHGLLGLLPTFEKDNRLVYIIGKSSTGCRFSKRGKKKKFKSFMLSFKSNQAKKLKVDQS